MPESPAGRDSKCAGDTVYVQTHLTPHVPDASVIAAPCSPARTSHLQSPTRDEGQGRWHGQSERKGQDIGREKGQSQSAESVWGGGDVAVYVDDVHRA
jgi:hypothetical protein